MESKAENAVDIYPSYELHAECKDCNQNRAAARLHAQTCREIARDFNRMKGLARAIFILLIAQSISFAIIYFYYV
jgi:hypothetical protein